MYVHLYIYIYISCICCICDSARLKTTSVEMIPVCQPCNVSDTELSNRGFLVKAINGTRLALLYRNALVPPQPEGPLAVACICVPHYGQRCAFNAAPFRVTCRHCHIRPVRNVHVVQCMCNCFVCDPSSGSEETIPPRGHSRSRSRSRAPTPDHEENPQP